MYFCFFLDVTISFLCEFLFTVTSIDWEIGKLKSTEMEWHPKTQYAGANYFSYLGKKLRSFKLS